MDVLKKKFKKKPKNLWKHVDNNKYQKHAISSEPNEADGREVYMDDLEKRKEVYRICGECNEPGVGEFWCQICNAKRFKKNFKNWTSENEDIDELIQESQINAVYRTKYLEWIPFKNFQNVTYITRGGFGRIYSAKWPEGNIMFWDIKNQKWTRRVDEQVALKSLDNSSDISRDFLNETKSYLQINMFGVIQCYGITQDSNTKDYMMVLTYCHEGDMRNYLNQSGYFLNYKSKVKDLSQIAHGLLGIHNAEKVHKDFHPGNVLFTNNIALISDLGICQPVNNEQSVKKGVYGVLPYMAPEVLRGFQYTKAADIYSFGIVMNEYLSEEMPYSDIPHDHTLAIKICKGFRPNISEDIPKLFADLITKCWDAKAENRPTAKELYQKLMKWKYYNGDINSEIYSQINECERIRKDKLKNNSSKNNKPKNIKTHPQAIYTSRLFNFKNLPEPENFSGSSFIESANQIVNPSSECLDCKINVDKINQDSKENLE